MNRGKRQKGLTNAIMGYVLGHFWALKYFDGTLKKLPEQVTYSEGDSHLPTQVQP